MRGMWRSMAAALAVVAVAGCGEELEEEADPAVEPVPEAVAPSPELAPGVIEALDATLTEWAVTLSRDSIRAGGVTINIRNGGSVTHAFEVEGAGQEYESGDVAPGAIVTMSLNLTAGEYKVYCPIVAGGTSHESRGMVTRLRVY